MFLPSVPIVHQCSLSLVLTQLISDPFEPRATCFLVALPVKVLFLVAIPSARRVGEGSW